MTRPGADQVEFQRLLDLRADINGPFTFATSTPIENRSLPVVPSHCRYRNSERIARHILSNEGDRRRASVMSNWAVNAV